MPTRIGPGGELGSRRVAVQMEALGGTVFDVLGEVTDEGKPLRQLLIEAIRLGDSPEVRIQMTRVIDEALDVEHLRAILATRALGTNLLDTTKLAAVRDELERAEANRLQPHYVRDFFLLAYRRIGGHVRAAPSGPSINSATGRDDSCRALRLGR